jgi:hypothetical protein
MLARLVRSLVIVAAIAIAPRISSAQDTAVRMEITSVGDSTFTFNSSQVGWVAKGQNGIVVDPRRRDVLVARFTVLGVNSGVGLALIVGQTQRVATDHMALLSQPQPAWYTRKSFWYGLAGGLAGGFLLGRL